MFVYSEVPNELQTKLFTAGCRDYVKVLQTYGDSDHEDGKSVPPPLPSPWSPEPCLVVRKYQQFAERIRDFVVYPDDIWVLTYPKCGTTWAQEMVWLLANNLDYATAKAVNLNQRSPYLEISSIGSNLHFDSVERTATACPRPRLIKSHLPMNLLPAGLFRGGASGPKLIYVTRNAKDAAVSYYHHYRMLLGYQGTLGTFLEAFLTGDVLYGSYFKHVEEFVRLMNESSTKSNLLIVRFEDMKQSMRDVLRRVSAFLKSPTSAISEPELDALAHHLSFEQMRQNDACNNETMARNAMNMNGRADEAEPFHFLRKGQVGTYMDEMPAELIAQFNSVEAQQPPVVRPFISM